MRKRPAEAQLEFTGADDTATDLVLDPNQAKSKAAPSAANKAYQQQLSKLEKLKTRLTEMQALAQTHRDRLTQRIHPLMQTRLARVRELVLRLDHALAPLPAEPTGNGTPLTPAQRRTAVDVLCSLCQHLIGLGGHDDLRAVHDRHAPQTLAEMARADMERIQAQWKAMTGEALMPEQDADEGNGDATPPTPEEVMAAMHAKLAEAQARDAAEQAAKAEKRAARAQKRQQNKPLTPAQQLAQQLQNQADTTLRSLYRQLASALHPDREPDEQARARKTELMGAVNIAYAKKDVLALIELQRQAQLADAHTWNHLPDEQVQAMTLLIKAQVADLERERAQLQMRLSHEFDVPLGMSLTERMLERLADEEEESLTDVIATLDKDLATTQTHSGLKRWLTQQQRSQRQSQQEQELMRMLGQLHAGFDDDEGRW